MDSTKPLTALLLLLCLTSLRLAEAGETLEVGPGKKFDKPSAAIAAAKNGDLIEIDAAGKYDGDVCLITKDNLTLRGVGKERAKLPAAGKYVQGKGIWVIQGKDTTVENIEFSGARVPDGNGAGIRSEGENLTVRNCKFHDCQDAILGGKGLVLIEHSEFSHCSLSSSPYTHNLYMSERVTKLIYRFNYSHHAKIANLLKSRAAENHILYNRITDESDGTGSYEIDLCNGGRSYVIGNILHKATGAQNTVFINFGTEGLRYPDSLLYVVNNSVVSDYRDGKVDSPLVRVKNVPDDFKLVIRNNIIIGRITLSNWPKALIEGNFTAGDPLFVDRAHLDFRLKPGSPCIDKGLDPGKAGDIPLRPESQYIHPCADAKRPDDGKIDIGAFEFAPTDK